MIHAWLLKLNWWTFISITISWDRYGMFASQVSTGVLPKEGWGSCRGTGPWHRCHQAGAALDWLAESTHLAGNTTQYLVLHNTHWSTRSDLYTSDTDSSATDLRLKFELWNSIYLFNCVTNIIVGAFVTANRGLKFRTDARFKPWYQYYCIKLALYM